MSRNGDSRGFTLLETMVALAILGIVLGGALAVAAADLRASRKAAANLEAAALAEDLLARLEVLSAEDLAELPPEAQGRFAAPLDRYRWRERIQPLDGEPGLWETDVTVGWSDGSVAVATRLAPSPRSDPLSGAGAP